MMLAVFTGGGLELFGVLGEGMGRAVSALLTVLTAPGLMALLGADAEFELSGQFAAIIG